MSLIEATARRFWFWLQMKLRDERLVTLDEALIDGTTIEVIACARVTNHNLKHYPGCWFGKKVVEKRYFFGQKLHMLADKRGTMLSFRFSSGNIHDRHYYHKLVDSRFSTVVADAAYRAIQPIEGQNLIITLPFEKSPWHGVRVAVERTFKFLKSLGLEKRLKLTHPPSLASHPMAVLTCGLAIQYLNLKTGRNPLSYARFR